METVACSRDAAFLLARAFRWAREAPSDPAVEFTIVANTITRAGNSDDVGTDVEDLTGQTTPGFHSRLAITTGVMAYGVKNEELAGDLPLESTLSGRARQQFSYQKPPINPENGDSGPVVATPVVGTPTPAAAPTTPPFVAGGAETIEELSLTITQIVNPGGLAFAIDLKSFAGDSTNPEETRSFDAFHVGAGVLTGIAVSDASDAADPTEY